MINTMSLRRRTVLVAATALAAAWTAGAATISGTVSSASSGVRLSSMVVAAYDTSGVLRANGTTATNGRYTLSVPPGDYRVLAYDPAGVFATAFDGGADSFETSPVRNVAEAVEIDFALVTGGMISGTVSVSGGGRLGDAVVEVYNLSGTRRAFGATDALGEYSIVVPPGDYKVVAYDPRGLLATQFHPRVRAWDEAAPVHVNAGANASGITFVLAAAAGISGTAVDGATGVALSGVAIYAYTPDGARVAQVDTDAAGAFRLDVPAGDYRLVAADPNRVFATTFHVASKSFEASNVLTVRSGEQLRDVRIALARGGTITGHVSAGPGIVVLAYNPDGTLHTEAVTGADGNYVLVAAAGEYRVVATDPAGVYASEFYSGTQSFPTAQPVFVTVGAPTTGVDFSLDRAGRFLGRVTRSLTSQPLADITIAAYAAAGVLTGSTRTGADGRYVLILPEGSYRVLAFDEELTFATAYAGGAKTYESTMPAALAPGATVTADFAMTNGVRVTGQVTDTQGNGLSGVEVFALDAVGERVAAGTSNDGAFVFVVPSGAYRFVAIDPSRRHAIRYYPDAVRFEDAAVVSILPGQSAPLAFSLPAGTARRRAVRH